MYQTCSISLLSNRACIDRRISLLGEHRDQDISSIKILNVVKKGGLSDADFLF